ncbi:MAG: adenine phosphoribosyltransferase [Tepidiformaceae bacterium]
MDLKQYIRAVPDFPKPGIRFRDLTPLLAHAEAFGFVLGRMAAVAEATRPGAIVGVESRGFLFGAPIAAQLGVPFAPVRKPGKLPAARFSVEYSLEYGQNHLEIHQDAFALGTRVYVIDDLLATGGTARATAQLVEMVGGVVVGLGFVIELEELAGRDALSAYPVDSLVVFRPGE